MDTGQINKSRTLMAIPQGSANVSNLRNQGWNEKAPLKVTCASAGSKERFAAACRESGLPVH
jgi:hypothetical protein